MDKKNHITAKGQKKEDNSVVYKVMIALLVLGLSLLGLRALRQFYGTVGGMELLDPMLLWIMIGGFAAGVIVVVVDVLVKNKISRMILPWVAVLSFLIGLTGLSMHTSWTQGFPMLYFLCFAILSQYIILQLYRWEFFLFSLSTMAAGATFLAYHTGFGGKPWGIVTLIISVCLLVAIALVTYYACSNHGMLVLGKKHITLFPAKSNPLLIYLVVALWMVCIVATIILGGAFAYYCMFAAIAVELIGGVYYTFQLN